MSANAGGTEETQARKPQKGKRRVGAEAQPVEAAYDAPAGTKPHPGRPTSDASTLLVRSATGAVYAISVIVCLWLGPVATAVIASVMATLSCVEVFRMMRMSGRMPNVVLGLVAAAVFPFTALLRSPLYLLVALMVFFIAVAAWHVWTPRSAIADVAVTLFGPLYTSLMLSSVVYIRCVESGVNGMLLALGVISSVWLNDTCAYFVGSRFGTHKLVPQISPNKSVEGLWGGLAGSIIPWIVLAILGTCGMNILIALPSGLAVGLASVMGDLFESRIKRGVGVKDSGNILPGHGGMLDRSDSLLFASAVAGLCLLIGGVL